VVYHAAGGGNYDPGPSVQLLPLAAGALAADNYHGLHAQQRSELLYHFGHLQRQFARGNQYEGFAFRGGEPLYHRYGESYGFARAGLGYAHHVVPCGGYGDGLQLYGGRDCELQFV